MKQRERPCRVFLEGYEMQRVIDHDVEEGYVLCLSKNQAETPSMDMIRSAPEGARVQLLGAKCLLFYGNVRVEEEVSRG